MGVNTGHPHKIVQEAANLSMASKKAFFKQWKGFEFYKSEFKISKETRLDGVFCRSKEDLDDLKAQKYFIEIKNTSLLTEVNGEKHAQFPDAVTERGQKHLIELMELIKKGHEAELIFTVQRTDAEYFSVAEQIDPKYAELFKKAQLVGLKMTPVIVKINQSEVVLTDQVLKIK